MSDRRRVAIIGAGLGGTTLANLLQDEDFEVRIYEQAPRFAKLGYGIDLSANAMRVMRHIGLEERLPIQGLRPISRVNLEWDTGRMMYDQPVTEWHKTYGFDLIVPRGDLHGALLSGLNPETVEWGKKLVSIDDGGGSPRVEFADGTSAEADIVVGSDGVNSRVRELLLGPTPASFGNVVVYRGALPTSIEMADTIKWWGEGRYFIAYYLTAARNSLCIISGVKADSWDMSVSSVPVTVEETHEAFAGFHSDVHAIIASGSGFSKWPLLVRDPLSLWSRGNIVLMGDACHPMKPHMGQGAAMAMEDAAMLTRCLAHEADHRRAFDLYRSLRIDRTSAIQKESNKNTWMRTEMDPGWVYGYDIFDVPLSPVANEGKFS